MCTPGNAHAVVYDYAGDGLYFVYASPWINNFATPGYLRQWNRLTMSALWAEQPPVGEF